MDILASMDQMKPLIKLVSNSGTNVDESCVLYMDSQELAKQVAGGANFVITGLDQLKEGTGSNVVVMEQLERANEQVTESQGNNVCLQEVRLRWV